MTPMTASPTSDLADRAAHAAYAARTERRPGGDDPSHAARLQRRRDQRIAAAAEASWLAALR